MDLLEIKKKIEDFNKYIEEYGFDSENDIFIIEQLEILNKILEEKENNLNGTKSTE
jgi:hypothetical protein